MPDQPGDSSEQSGATRDRFTMVLGIVEPHVEVPPVVDECDQVGHQPTGGKLSRGKAIPTPLVLEFVVDVLRVRTLAVEPRQSDRREGYLIERGDQHGDAARSRRRTEGPSFAPGQSSVIIATTTALLAHGRECR